MEETKRRRYDEEFKTEAVERDLKIPDMMRYRRVNGHRAALMRCRQHACVVSFFPTLNLELMQHARYRTREEAQQGIFEYLKLILFHNRIRRHSTRGYRSPAKARDGGCCLFAGCLWKRGESYSV